MTKATKTTKKSSSNSELKVSVLDGTGKTASDINIQSYFPESEIEEGFSPSFIHQVLLTYLDNKRQNTAKVKTRSEVRGGGRKPWRQKGTGRARHGTIRSPLWRSGGVTFGPTGQQNFTKKLTKKMKKKAMRFGLLSLIQNNSLIVIDKFEKNDSTKSISQLLSKLPLVAPVMLVVDKEIITSTPALNNIEYIDSTSPELLNPLDLFTHQSLVCTQKSFEMILNRIQPGKSVSKEEKESTKKNK